jgi:hypothetical protein
MRKFKNSAWFHEKLGDKTNKPQKHFSNKRDAYFPNNYVSYGYFIAVSQYSITLAAKVE